AFAFLLNVTRPTTSATAASHIHTFNHASALDWSLARPAASRAVTPITTPPSPETAVKEDAHSIVSRMKRKLSIACAWSGTGLAPEVRIGWTEAIVRLYAERREVTSTL